MTHGAPVRGALAVGPARTGLDSARQYVRERRFTQCLEPSRSSSPSADSGLSPPKTATTTSSIAAAALISIGWIPAPRSVLQLSPVPRVRERPTFAPRSKETHRRTPRHPGAGFFSVIYPQTAGRVPPASRYLAPSIPRSHRVVTCGAEGTASQDRHTEGATPGPCHLSVSCDPTVLGTPTVTSSWRLSSLPCCGLRVGRGGRCGPMARSRGTPSAVAGKRAPR